MVCIAAPPGEAAMACAHSRAAETSQAYMSERCSRSASSVLSTSSSSLPVGKMILGHHRLFSRNEPSIAELRRRLAAGMPLACE